jgi:GNAT superfamily N-acetyltransferase
MATIRHAQSEDLDALIDMGAHFFGYSEFSRFATFDKDAARASLLAIMQTGVVMVAEVEGEIAGGIVGVLAPLWFNPAFLAATECAWWVKEEFRGGTTGVKLLWAFEEWAKQSGAAMVAMSDLVINGEMPAGRLFEKLNYVAVERSHVKKVA